MSLRSIAAVHRRARSCHDGIRIGRFLGAQENIHGAPRQVSVPVPLPAEGPSPVGFLARGADGGLRAELVPNTEGLPLDHPRHERFVDVAAVFVRAGLVQGHANVRSRPGCGHVLVPHPAHVPSFEVLLACLTNSQARVRKLNIERLFEPWWCKCQYVLIPGVRSGIGLHCQRVSLSSCSCSDA